MIVSESLPNRTPLALKNRYSALRAKRQQTPAKFTRQSGSEIRQLERAEQTDDEGDDDDEDEDDEEEDDGDSVNVTDNTHTSEPSWQGSVPTNSRTAPSQGLIKQFMPQHPLALPASIPPSTTTDLWGNELRGFPLIPNTMSSEALQGDYHYNNDHTSSGTLPTSMDTNYGMDSYYTMLPSFRAQQNTGLSCNHWTDSPTHDPDINQMPDLFEGGSAYAPAKDQGNHSVNENNALSSFHVTLDADRNAQQEISSPKRQCLRTQSPSTVAAPSAHSQAPGNTPSPVQNASCHERPRANMHRVSVDAECTTSQLGDLVRTLVGVTNKVVFRVDE